MIPVTKAFLPKIEEYQAYLLNIWDKKWLTNRGPLLLELEDKLKNYLQVENLLITNNGTIPIQIALKIFGNGGEIITTPFSYVATTTAIIWENCTPVFVDIHPEYLTIDETKIEAAITEKTTAILATHVYGNPCEVMKIEAIAKKHDLKVIYDAAHCFGVKYLDKSIFNFGDISTCSFHATKLFHTGEGGGMFCNYDDTYHKMFYHHNFGHNGPSDFSGVGINGKSSELHAAMGLAVLPHIKNILQNRKDIVDHYIENLNVSKLQLLKIRENTEWNYSYFPVIFESEQVLINVIELLNKNDIFPRRYFYPSINKIEYINGKEMPVSESISKKVLCLPLYFELSKEELNRICSLVNSVI